MPLYSCRNACLAVAAFAALATQPSALAQGTEDAFVVKIPGQSMTASVTLSPSNATGVPGQTLDLPLNLSAIGTATPATFQADLSFDQQKLTFNSARAAAPLTGAGKTLSTAFLSNGDVRMVATGVNQTAIPNGLIAYGTFALNSQFLTGSTTVTMKNCSSSNALGGVLATGCTTATIRPFSCDLNGDGAINVADVQILINEVLGIIPAVHDLNHDGAVTVADVQKLSNAVLGLGCPY